MLDDNRKPNPEKQYPLDSLVDLKIKTRNKNRDGWKVLHEGFIPVTLGTKTTSLMYPDLTKLAGRPLSPSENLDYYTKGDKYFSHPGNTYIRALAFRAARYPYNKIEDSAMPAAGQLVAKGDPEDPGPLFPEKQDVRGVVKSVAYFVHDSLYDKDAGYDLVHSHTTAEQIWKGEFGPDKTKEGNIFICQEHSFLLGSMLRALGIAVREVNVMEFIYPFGYDYSFIKIENINQDACSEVWHNHRWNFWGLFSSEATNDEPFRDHWKRYAGYILKYDLYVGTTRSEDGRNRFHMSRDEMDTSLLWKYIGAGTRSGFYNYDVRHEVAVGSTIYWALSPVVAKVVLPDGRSIGASVALDPKEFRKYVFEGGKKPEGLVNEIEGASYYPEGMMLYPNAADKKSAIRMKQSIVMPVKHVNEIKDHKLVLKGTGDGPYEIKVSYVSPVGKATPFGSVKGMAQKGKTMTHTGTEFDLASIVIPVDQPAADDVAKTPGEVEVEEIGKKEWRVWVTLDNAKTAMTAHVEFLGKRKDSEAALAKKAKTAALPGMMSFVESLAAVNKSTFKDLFNKDSSLKEEVESVLKNAVFSDIGRTREGNPTYTLWVPVSEIRMAAGLEPS